MIRKYIIVADDSIKGFKSFDEEIAKLEREWGAEEIEPCEDCISREAVIKIFGEVHPMDYNTQAYITNIQNLPSITPQQTNKIEESNYSKEQYEADLQGAYDCGYNCGYTDAMIDIAESKKV